ncbi:MAG TPA: SRPBCC domain-containing protein [Candidatus Binataceae bacterium]|nr:SRPBCC domain-containing protein [Candidatus Binataceae bacterium]
MDAQSSTAAMPEDRVLVIERTFDAPRPLVFKAWTEAERMARWFGPHGFTNTVISHDFRVGGGYRLHMRSPQGTEHFLKGVYREIVEPERLVSTFVWTDADGNATRPETVLTVTLAEHGAKTRLKLHQAVFESVTARDSHRGGWTDSMERLANFLAAAA